MVQSEERIVLYISGSRTQINRYRSLPESFDHGVNYEYEWHVFVGAKSYEQCQRKAANASR